MFAKSQQALSATFIQNSAQGVRRKIVPDNIIFPQTYVFPRVNFFHIDNITTGTCQTQKRYWVWSSLSNNNDIWQSLYL